MITIMQKPGSLTPSKNNKVTCTSGDDGGLQIPTLEYVGLCEHSWKVIKYLD